MVELIIVMSIFVIAIAATAPFLGSFQRTASLETHVQDLMQLLRRAQLHSVTGVRREAWGVHVENGAIVLFAGDTYGTRLTEFDERHIIGGPVHYSGSGEVVFMQVTGSVMHGPASIIVTSESDAVRVDVGKAGSITRSGFGT